MSCQERNYSQFTSQSWWRPCRTCHYWCSCSSECGENGPKWFPRSKHIRLDSRSKSLSASDKKRSCCRRSPWPCHLAPSWSWRQPCRTCCYWCSCSSEGCENGPKWFPRSKNISLDSRSKSVAFPKGSYSWVDAFWEWSVAVSGKKIWPIYSTKLVMTSSYMSSLMFRFIWGLWKWSQMIPQVQKYKFGLKNQVSSWLRREVVVGGLHDHLGPSLRSILTMLVGCSGQFVPSCGMVSLSLGINSKNQSKKAHTALYVKK